MFSYFYSTDSGVSKFLKLFCFKIYRFSFILKIAIVLSQFHTQAKKRSKIPTLKVRQSFCSLHVPVLF